MDSIGLHRLVQVPLQISNWVLKWAAGDGLEFVKEIGIEEIFTVKS